MIKPDLNPAPHILKQFAWFAVPGLPLLVLVVLRIAGAFSWTHPAVLVAVGLGVVQLALYLAGISAVTRAAYVVLMVVAVPIGFVISHVLMWVIYFLVMTPIALVFRAMGRDVLGRKLEAGRASYWHERSGPRKPASYFKLY